MRIMLVAALLLAVAAPVRAPAAMRRPIVIELFTSQGCSSCPPADALLRELARDPAEYLALGFHVTYWNELGWRDPFSLPAATQRQRGYQRISGVGSVYTPQMVIDGTADVIGSDRAGVARARAAAAAAMRAGPALTVAQEAGQLSIGVGAGMGQGRLWLVGYDPRRRTAIGRGENAGQVETEANVVRAIDDLGAWTGDALALHVRMPAGAQAAVLLQAPDGAIIGAAVAPLPAR